MVTPGTVNPYTNLWLCIEFKRNLNKSFKVFLGQNWGFFPLLVSFPSKMLILSGSRARRRIFIVCWINLDNLYHYSYAAGEGMKEEGQGWYKPEVQFSETSGCVFKLRVCTFIDSIVTGVTHSLPFTEQGSLVLSVCSLLLLGKRWIEDTVPFC